MVPHWSSPVPWQVCALCMYPELLSDSAFPSDVKGKAERLLAACAGQSVGEWCTSPIPQPWGPSYVPAPAPPWMMVLLCAAETY